MSMLADWFFCTAMRMSAADTHAFLDSLAALRHRDPRLPDVLDAATALESAPPWSQLYALRPLLTVHGRLADRSTADAEHRLDTPDGPPGDAAAGYGDAELGALICRLGDLVLSSTDHPLAARLGALFTDVVNDVEGARAALLTDVATPLAEGGRQSDRRVASTPYHELADRVVETVTVIALAELARRRPTSAAQDWLGDTANPLLRAATQGDHGRLALLAAVDAAGRVDPGAREELWRHLWFAGAGAPHLQPDLLDGLARLWYGQPDGGSAPSVAMLETEAVTGDDLELWSSVRRPDRNATDDFYALLTGHANGAWDTMAAVLWPSILWSLAAEVDPAETARRLARWWQLPQRPAGTPGVVHVGIASTRAAQHLTLLRQLSLPRITQVPVDAEPVELTSPEHGSAVCSPWLYRSHDRWDHGRRNGPAFRTRAGAEPLVRLLSAAALSASLLQSLPDADDRHDHLTALVFHTVDVLRDHAAVLTALDLGEYVDESPLGPALVSLLWHVNLVLRDAGTGLDERSDPRLLARFAERVLHDDATLEQEENEQLARFARQSVGAICTMWIRFGWARASGIGPVRGPGRWFDGDPPHALRILMATLDRLSLVDLQYHRAKSAEAARRREIDREWAGQPRESRGATPQYGLPLTRGMGIPDLMPAAQLLREIYPEDWPEPVGERWPQLDIDWYRDRNHGSKLQAQYESHLKRAGGDPEAVAINTVRAERLLLSPAHPLPVWAESATDLEGWTRVDAAPITMRALRLAALLRDPDAAASDAYREWIEEWLDRIHAVNQGSELSLDVRAIMIRLIAPRPAEVDTAHRLAVAGSTDVDVEYQRRLSAVHEATIDVILEFGMATPRHVEMLLERLAAQVGLGREGTDRLRLRALETIYRQQRYRAPRLTLGSASGLRRQRATAADLELAIRRFLDGIGEHTTDVTERIPVLGRARELWEQSRLRAGVRGHRLPLVDRRRHRGDQQPGLLVAATVTDRFRGQEVSYLLDVVRPNTDPAEHSGGPHDLFPSVADRQRLLAEATRKRRRTVAVVAAVEGGRVWFNAGLGDLITYRTTVGDPPLASGDVVAVQLLGNPPAVVGVERLRRPAPEPGEVRTARVHLRTPWLRVHVDGVPGNVYPTDDGPAAVTVRRQWDPDLSRAFGPATVEPLSALVRWDSDLANWVPVPRSLNELVIDEPELSTGLRLVHAGGDLFVTRPGHLYRLDPADWADAPTVTGLLADRPAGTILRVARAATPRSGLRLEHADDRNVRWLHLFSDNEQELTVATRESSGYHLTVEAPEGFPATVVVRGAEGGAQRAYVITTAWDDRRARLAEVRVTLVRGAAVDAPDRPSAERFHEMWEIRERDTLTLRRIFSTSVDNALVLTSTSTGLAVRLETDSLTLLDPHLVAPSASGLVKGRTAEVVQVYRAAARPAGVPVSVDDLAARVHTVGADPAAVRRLLTSADTVQGVLVSQVSTSRGDTMYGTWCRFGSVVHFVELDRETLGGTGSRPELLGQLFTGRRAGHEWIFQLTPRKITVRGLFELRADGDAEGTVFVGSDGVGDLYQQPSRPVLVRRPAEGGDPLRRLDLGGAEVADLGDRIRSTRTVAVRTGPSRKRVTYLGTTSYAGHPADCQLTDVRLIVSRTGAGRPDLVQARRRFELRPRRTAPAPPQRPIDYAARWQQFLDSRQQHLIGNIVGGHIEVTGGLRPPGPNGELTGRLPLAPGQEPAVAGVPYRSLGARVRLVAYGDGYVGSYATAEPRTVPEFMALMQLQVSAAGSAQKLAHPLYYVGPPTAELDAHLFEWGYGWTVAVRRDQLRVAHAPDSHTLPPLFHGDQVVAVSFTEGDDGEPVMVVDWRHIRHRFVTQLVLETRRHFLHLLDVEVGMAAGTLRVLRAQTTQRRGGDPFRGAEWVPFPATLDQPSIELIFQKLRDAGETGVVRQRVLARLDLNQAVSTGGRDRVFQAVRPGGVGLEDGDYVFLTAQGIEEGANELTLIFGQPDSLNADDLAVRVNRREFSFRESTLARLRTRGLDVESGKTVMLVQVRAVDARGVRHGSVRDAPARQPETLVSYLASRGGSCYALFGRSGRAGRLEIAPGVLYSTDGVLGAEAARPGAVVRLSLDERRRVVLTTALPADVSYVAPGGRPAVVLPKSILLRPDAGRDREMRRAFVVSGLPDAQITPEAGTGAVVLGTRHPKIVWVYQGRHGDPVLRPARPGEVLVARLHRPDPNRPADLRPQSVAGGQRRGAGAAEQHPRAGAAEQRSRAAAGEHRDERTAVPWARMSFRDGSAQTVARACEYEWRHHDQRTGHVRGNRVAGYAVAPGSMLSDGVFFDDDAGWTLRYRPHRLSAFGFPATELLDAAGLDRGLPVAGPSADGGGVWVELGPGRVVEVRGTLVTLDGRTALDRLDWSAFAPGDEIGLRSVEAEPGGDDWHAGHGHLMLTSWRPAVTGALPRHTRDARILVPVRGLDRRGGALWLADRSWRVTYPMARRALGRFDGVDAVWLDARHDVTPLGESTVRPGDTVLLGVTEDGRLTVAGLPDTEVRLAPRGERDWPGSDWLYRGLTRDRDRAALLGGLDNQLPVTVHTVERAVVTVSREHQPPGRWPRGRQVRTEVTGCWGGDRLLLRSGAAVHSVPVGDAVAGVPAQWVAAAAEALVRATSAARVLWWRCGDDGRPLAGLTASADDSGAADVVVVPQREVTVDGVVVGVVCRDVATARLHWLSAAHASWVRDVPAGDLVPNLGSGGRITARVRPDGSLSINTRPAVSHQLRRLELGHPLRIVLGVGRPRATGDGRWRYLARLEVPPVLMSYLSPDPDLQPGTSRLAEVDELDRAGQPEVVTVPINGRKVMLDLPSWLPAAHDAIVAGESVGYGPFTDYAGWFQEGLADGFLPDDPAEAVLRLAGDLLDDDVEVDVDRIRAVAGRWLATTGTAVLNLVNDEEVDAAPALAGALALDALGGTDPQWARAAVLYLHQLGRRAAASLHTEQIATAWVGRPGHHRLGGAWARLRALSLTRELDARQVRHLRAFCRAMLTKPALRTAESALAPIARSLLAAVGELESAEHLLQDAVVLAGPAGWARTLLPAAGFPTAQPSLLPAQRRELRALADHVVGDAVPLTLLPVVAPPTHAETEFARRLLGSLPGT